MCGVTGCMDIFTPIAVYCCWFSATAHIQHTHFKLGSMERQSSVVLLVLMFLMLKGNYQCAADTCVALAAFGSLKVMDLGSSAQFISSPLPFTESRQIKCPRLHIITNLKWVIFTNLVSGTKYKCTVNGIECSYVASNHTTTTQDITGVVASVFHPLHNNTDLTTAQISWRLANSSQSPSSYDVRIRCIRVREKQQLQPLAFLEHIQGSPFHTNTSHTHFNLVNMIHGSEIPRLPPQTYCVVDVKLSDSTIWSEPHVFSTQASVTPHNETVIVVDSYIDCSDEESAVLVLKGQDRHEYTCIEGQVHSLALDNKNRVVFAVNNTHVIKMVRPLSRDMKLVKYSLLKELTLFTPSIAYDWLSEMLYVSGWVEESDYDGGYEFFIMRKLVIDGTQGDFEILNHTSQTVEKRHQLTVNPLSGMMHFFAQDSNEIHRLQINPRISSSPESVPLFSNFTSFAEDVVNNCIILADRVGRVYRLESGEKVLKLGTCSGHQVNTTMLSLMNDEHLRKISLDQLGIYYVLDISMNHAYHDAVNYQIRNRSSLGHFGDVVSFISSTSPGMQPYPEDLECLVGKSHTIRLINNTEHSINIAWHISPSNNIECLHVSRPKLKYQVTISAESANIQMISLSSAHISGLQPGTNYTVSVIGESINVRLQWQQQLFGTVCRNGSCHSISNPESSSVVATMAAVFSPSSVSLTQAKSTPSSTPHPQQERLSTEVIIIIAGSVIFAVILTVVVTVFIIITATCHKRSSSSPVNDVIYDIPILPESEEMKMTECTAYDTHKMKMTECAAYDTHKMKMTECAAYDTTD